MSNLFDLVSDFSGQKNSITIPRIYIKLCNGDFTTAAVLSQLVFWSSKGKRADGYFWKSYDEIANELCEDEITSEQVRYSVKKLKMLLSNCFFVEVKRANGMTTNHYRFDQAAFLERLQNLKSGNFPNRAESENGKIPNQEISHSEMGNFPDTVNGKIPTPITDPNHIQTTDPKKNTKKSEDEILLEQFGISGQLAKDFITHRKSKRAAITKTVLVGYQREAHKAGIPLAKAITISIERNWQGFKAEWNWRDENIATATNTRKTSAFADDGSWAVGRKLNIDPDLIPEELR
nr:MAG TPA: hypothetical protein [Caudoviricetes sp.]